LFAPAGVPEAILERLRSEVKKALESPEVKQRLNSAGGLEPLVLTPQEFSALMRRDYEKYGRVVKDLGVKLD
jgi:tripartite-type tricarboxylate transporter receptor subunit TctC